MATAAAAACMALAAPGRAAETTDSDRFDVRVGAETDLRLFQRVSLPGPGGALVQSTRSAPLYQYTMLQLSDVDLPWEADSLDMELSAWSSADVGQLADQRRLDGDIQAAWVRHRVGPTYVTLGRQLTTGGAARLTHFDGVAAGVLLPVGFGADAYGGLAVLPRWSERPGYKLLGSATDTMLRTPDLARDPQREDQWLVGARLHYAYEHWAEVGASFHEQHEQGGLGRRNVGVDFKTTPHEVIAASGYALVDGDAWGLTEARFFVDVVPVSALTITTELLHTTPALFLSRQSVLSVFSTDPYDEVGGIVGYRLLDGLWLGAGGYADVFGDGTIGGRLRGDLRLSPPGLRRLVLRTGYRRVVEPVNGYHAPRVAVSYRLIDPLALTVDTDLYLYDSAIRNVTTAWQAAANAEWSFRDGVAVMLGGSLSRSPYAALDAQAIARLRLDLDWRIQ